MKDPRPLLREGASDFERQLLSAAMRERPSPQMRSQMRLALGLTGPLAWASSVKAMLASLAGKGAIGVAVVGLVAAGAIGLGSTDDGAASVLAASSVAVAPASVARAEVPAPAPAAEDERAPPQQREAASSRELREEILLLDQARSALQGGSGAAALEQLDRYRSRFPSGILSREAAVLRQQAVAASGPRSRRAR